MFLQKTGWRIKQFIVDRKNPSTEFCKERCSEQGTSDWGVPLSARKASWLSQNSTHNSLTLRRSSSNATTKTRLVSETPTNTTNHSSTHSSASSLCSCDCALHQNPSKSPLLRDNTPPIQPKIRYLPILPLSETSDDAIAWQLIFSDEVSPSSVKSISYNSPRTSMVSTKSTSPRVEAQGLQQIDNDQTSTRGLVDLDPAEISSLSEDMAQLARETDRAFKAVGDVLENAKIATQDWSHTNQQDKGIETAVPTAKFNTPIPRTKGGSRLYISKLHRPRVLRKKSTKSLEKREPQALRPIASSKPSKWAFEEVTTSWTGVFSNRVFRTTPNKVMTQENPITRKEKPGAVQRIPIHTGTINQTEACISSESVNPEFFPTRTSAPQRNEVPSGAYLSAMKSPKIKRRFQGKRLMVRKVGFVEPVVKKSANDAATALRDVRFFATPRTPRIRSTPRSTATLPTIPELHTLNYITLQSTPFTLTAPLYYHGPIRIDRCSTEYNMVSPQDEALDWTTFQMAILGTMDDDEGDQRDYWMWEADERELNDIVAWFEGFGFGGYGALEAPPPRKPLLQDDDKEVVAQHKSEPGNMDNKEIIAKSILTFATSSHGSLNSEQCRKGLWASKGLEAQLRRPSMTDSLPPSPMQDLLVYNPIQERDFVPMGYNLGHDLGDFLDWEAKNVQTLFLED